MEAHSECFSLMEDTEPNNNSRKRARSSAAKSVPSSGSGGSTAQQEQPTPLEAAELDRSRAAQLRRTYGTTTSTKETLSSPASVVLVPPSSPQIISATLHSRRTSVLNDLLRASMAHDKVYALSSDEILQELVLLVAHDCLQWPEDTPLPSAESFTSSAKVGGGDRGAAAMAPSPPSPPSLPIFSSKRCWLEAPTRAAQEWAQHWKLQLGGSNRCQLSDMALRQLEVVLVIIRNLSFVSSNLRLLAYSPAIWHLLVGCLYEGTDQEGLGSDDSGTASSSSATTSVLVSHSAMHTLLNLAPHLDVSGQRLCGDKLFYPPPPPPPTTASSSATTTPATATAATIADAPPVPNPSNFGLTVGGHWGFGGLWLAKRLDTKEDTLNDVSSELIVSLTSNYLVAVWSLFPALHHLLTQPKPPPRAVVLLALDLLQDLINQAKSGMVGKVHTHDAVEGNSGAAGDGTTTNMNAIPSIRQILVHMPDALLDRLVDWLYVPRLGPDALEYIDPTQNVVTRITTLKLLMGYDATIDSDVRDRTLEVLVPLLELDSPRMAARIGRCCGNGTDADTPRLKLFDSLVPILTTNTGRSEASSLTIQLLRELKLAPENALGLEYIRPRLVELASRDARVSNLLWHHLTPRPASDSDNDDEKEDEEDGEDDDDEEEEEEEEEGAANSSDDSNS